MTPLTLPKCVFFMNHLVRFVLHHINFFPFHFSNLILVAAFFPMTLLLSGTNYLFYFVFLFPFLLFLPLLRHIYFLHSHLFIYGLIFGIMVYFFGTVALNHNRNGCALASSKEISLIPSVTVHVYNTIQYTFFSSVSPSRNSVGDTRSPE